MGELLQQTILKLIEADKEEASTFASADHDRCAECGHAVSGGLKQQGSPQWQVFDWLALKLGELLTDHSDTDQKISRELIHAQAAAHELKLNHQRKATQRQLLNQGAELEANYNKKVADRLRELRGEDANRELDEAYKVKRPRLGLSLPSIHLPAILPSPQTSPSS